MRRKFNIEVRANTPKEEFECLTTVLTKLPFYLKHGYTIVLPDIDELRSNRVVDGGNSMYPLFLEKEYNENFFCEGIKKVREKLPIIESVLPRFSQLNNQWGFKLLDRYDVLLTKYGPGGHYDIGGIITMMTRKDGTFKRGSPEITIIHEIVHIGIEEGIVQKFSLSHSEKERAVDLLTLSVFGDILPTYVLQSRGDSRIDTYVNKGLLANNLPLSIEEYTNNFPR